MATSRREVAIPGWDTLQWRQIVVQGPQQTSETGVKLSQEHPTRCGGGFCYKEGSHMSSVTRNRFLIWRCLGNVLEIVEQSLDVNLCNNAVRFCFPGCILLPDVIVTELSHSMVVLVATNKTVHRLSFPHPTKLPVVTDTTLTLTGSVEPAHPSILYNCSSEGLLESSNYSLITVGSSDVMLVPAFSAYLSVTGKATFVIGTETGSMVVVTLPAHGSGDFSQQMEVRQTSMMQRLWSGIVPSIMRQSGCVPESVCSVCLHTLGSELYIFALCRDSKLRIWCATQWECIHTVNLADYIADVTDLRLPDDCHHLLTKSPGESLKRVGLAAYLAFDGKQQVCFMQVEVIHGEMAVHHVANRPLSVDRVVSMSVSKSEVWLQSSSVTGQPSIMHTPIDSAPFGSTIWNTVSLDDRYIPRLDATPLECDPRDNQFLLGMFADSRTGITGLVKQSAVSLIRPCDALETVYLSEPGLSSFDLPPPLPGTMEDSNLWDNALHVLNVCQLVSKQFPADSLQQLDEVMDIGDVHGTLQCVTVLLSSDNQCDGASSRDGLSEALLQLADIDELAASISSLLSALDIAALTNRLLNLSDSETDPERALWCQKLFRSGIGVLCMSGTVQQVASLRRRICRDLLLTIYGVLQRRNEVGLSTSDDWSLSSESREQSLQLMCVYNTLQWMATTPLQAVTQSQLEANVHQLSALNMTDVIGMLHASHSTALADGSSLLDLCISATAGAQFRNVLATRSVFMMPQHLPLIQLLLHAVNIVIDIIWPVPSNPYFADFLVSRCQYQCVEELVSLCSQMQRDASNAYTTFLLGQCYIQTREMNKATDCFIRASQGIDEGDGPMARFHVELEDGSSTTERLVAYFTKVVRLFDQHDWSAQVISMATAALSVADSTDSNVPILWSSLFKHQLQLQHNHKAYIALCSNPDPIRRQDCLRRLVYVLYEQHSFEELCQLPFVGLEDEVVTIMEARARCVDISAHSYYELLYSFHIVRGSYKKAAASQYECAVRLATEMPTVRGLQRRAKCLVAAMNALRLVQASEAWLVKPTGRSDTQDLKRLRDTMTSSSAQDSGHQPVQVVDLRDLREEHVLVSARLKLLQRNADAGTSTDAEELVTLLIAAGLFTVALDVSQMFSFPPTPVLEGLAARCANLTAGPNSQLSKDVEDGWEWLSANDMNGVRLNRTAGVVECSWQLLRHCIFHRVKAEERSQCFCAITVHFLSVSATLPQWFLDAYKVENPGQLLQLLVKFGRVQEAGQLAIQYMRALLGTGREEFAVKHAVHAQSPVSWLPYNVLDHLATSLNTAASSSSSDAATIECLAKFQEQLDRYFEAVTYSSESRLASSHIQSAALLTS